MLGASLELSTPFPSAIVCPGLGLLIVHVLRPFKQILGMEIGEEMAGHGIKCERTLNVLLHIAL